MLREGCVELSLAARMCLGEKHRRRLFYQMASFPAKAISWGLTLIENPLPRPPGALLILLIRNACRQGHMQAL